MGAPSLLRPPPPPPPPPITHTPLPLPKRVPQGKPEFQGTMSVLEI